MQQPVGWQINQPQAAPWNATAAIQPGTLILAERPLITLTVQSNAVDARNAVNVLPVAQRTWFNALPIAPAFSALDPNLARFRTNSFRRGTVANVQGDQDLAASGIFPYGLYFHSSCVPNVHAHWDSATTTLQFRAIRPIGVNAPLSISFDLEGLLQPCAVRQTRLQQHRNLQCACDICGNGLNTVASDARRNFVGPIVRHPPNNLQSIVNAWLQLQQEGLYLFQDTLAYDCFRLDPNPASAIDWLRRAYSGARAKLPANDIRVRHLRELGDQLGGL